MKPSQFDKLIGKRIEVRFPNNVMTWTITPVSREPRSRTGKASYGPEGRIGVFHIADIEFVRAS